MPDRREAAQRASRPLAPSGGGGADVRAQILEAAIKTIEESGLADVSMREVARRAGVSHQLPYHYFTDRESILAAIAEQGFAILRERLERVVTGRNGRTETAAERLAAAGRTYVAFACEHPAHFRVMFRRDYVAIDRFPSTKACADSVFDLLPRIIQDCIIEGLPPEPNPTALVVLGWSMTHGLACLLLDGPLEKKLPDVAAAREALIHDVMDAMKRMVEAASERGAKHRPVAARSKKKPR
jgi:AcrR family transcriptional regulator